jgi:hypothetical protein
VLFVGVCVLYYLGLGCSGKNGAACLGNDNHEKYSESKILCRRLKYELLGDATAVESKTSKGWRLEDLADFD